MDNDRITYFAETDSRNKRVAFGIKSKDRSRHVYVIGKTGMGKSTLLENMAVQDIQNGEGMAFIDPHGKTAELLLEYVPQDRMKDVVYFAPFDTEYPISFNVMEDVGPNKRHLVANGLMSAFKKIWVDAWSARMEYILNNILLALLEYPDSTLIGVNRMLADKDYRKKVVDNITDPSVKAFWTDEFAKYGDRYMQEAGAAIQNKIGQFIANPLVRNIIGQPKSSFDLRKMMDENKIMIVNLSKGRVGEANANLLGSMLITKIYLAAMSRADTSESKLKSLPQFYLYVDEFQSFANESFADILSEARKYKLNLTMAHQYIEQMSEEVRAAVFGNVGTMIVFRVGAYDAEVLEKEFAPTFSVEDLVNLGFVQIYLKLMIDGVTSPPFSATTLPPIDKPDISFRDDIIENSRKTFASPRSEVEEQIKKWHEPVTSIRRDDRPRPPQGTVEFSPRPQTQAPSSMPSQLPQQPSQPQPVSKVSQPPQPSQPPPAPQPPQQTPPPPRPPEPPRSIQPTSPQRPLQQSPQPPRPDSHRDQLPHQARPVSLDTLKKDKGPSGKNLSELKNALRDLVEQTKQHSEKKDEGQEGKHNNKPQEKPAIGNGNHKSQVKDNPKPSKDSPPQSHPPQKEKPREVPEDVLRKVINGSK